MRRISSRWVTKIKRRESKSVNPANENNGEALDSFPAPLKANSELRYINTSPTSFPYWDFDDFERSMKVVERDRRSEPRRVLNHQQAWIVAETDQTPVAVIVTNISKSGANLQSEHGLPKEFTLYFTPEGSVQRRCRIIWQS